MSKLDLGNRPPTPPTAGSFISSEAIKEKIDATKAAEAINRNQTEAEKKQDEAEEAKRVKEIDALLPETILCCLGEVSFETFKRWYKVIWDQVSNKDHLARGYCVFDNEPAPGLKVGYRTFRNNEMRVLSKLSPVTLPTEDATKASDESYLFRTVRLVLGMIGWDGTPLPPITIPKASDDIQKWLALPDVAARIDLVESLPEAIVDIAARTLADVTMAYRLALQENLKNLYAPL